ncbi:DegT/DnrJ/EryC1/StrS aminotransferase family protein [Sphaerobacter sp.]|uniref:DegT/DnrJ/EryC1/StrS family aminotransferase n=1 Tax=Sphaerobacter sp. TaxID=2099654 RepID=UPI001D5E46F5|nr:DegT/DnrJ/EryC1/StrS family aminotransferase [Sphaerobacter sp.]MBX5443638.1 DegT/DnrJ/EryC1/StrS family aminotransferase [Sphaerobacter sp.]
MSTLQSQRRIPFVDLAAQYDSIAPEVDAAIARVLRGTDFILGADVTAFEREFADYCEIEHAVGVDSGTSALELALRAFNIGPGDEVITQANTFVATVFAIAYTGATPVLVDVDPSTYNMDPELLEQAITPRTKAILPVHLYGQPADMDPIVEIARRYGLIVIEDACQAHGARYKGRRVGTFGHAAAFSFYPAKNLGAYGDGGMVVTPDAKVADTVRLLGNYGQREKYHHLQLGFNRRLDTLQAAVMRVKLRYLDEWNAARRRHAERYAEVLPENVGIPSVPSYAEPVWHLYVIRVPNRDALRAALAERGIATGIHYPIPIHLLQACSGLGYRRGDFPVTEAVADQILSLPMYPELSDGAIDYVAAAIRDVLERDQPAPGIARTAD